MMVNSSCAPFSSNRSEKEAKNEGLHFYRIPKNAERRRLWFNDTNKKDLTAAPAPTFAVFISLVRGEYDLLVHG